MSLLNKASLIQIPSGYKDGTLYSAKPTNGDGDFTFSRGSNLAATRINSEGLIEKGRENLLLHSNNFDNWSKNISVTGGQAGYDGTNDAYKLVSNASSGGHRIFQSQSRSGVLTYSIYAKPAGYNFMFLYINGKSAYFDLSGGSVGTTSGLIDSNISSAGNGYYRCSITFSGITTSNVEVYIANTGSSYVFTGDGVSGILIQDVQLEVGLVATDYIETTTTTEQAGILEDMPRLDYSGGASCGSLLLEPQRSNVLTQSEYFGAWSLSNATLTANDAESPEGVINGYKLNENTTNSTHRISQTSIVTTGQGYTQSVFAKGDGSGRYLRMFRGSGTYNFAVFNLTSGEIVSQGGSNLISTNIESYSNGWYKCSLTFTAQFSNIASYIGLQNGSFDSYEGDGTSGIYIYGAMLEEGSYPTSYIPTYGGSSVTRSNDVADGVTIDTTANHTLLYDFDGTTGRETSSALFNIGYDNSNRYFIKGTSSSSPQFQVSGVGVFSGNINPTNEVLGRNKIAVQWIDGTGYVYCNGVKQSGTLSNSSSANDIDYYKAEGRGYSHEVNQLVIFNTALTDSECEQLTTI